MGLKSRLTDTLDNVFDLLFSGAVGHVDNHGDDLSLDFKTKKPRCARGFGGIFEDLYCPGSSPRSCTAAANGYQKRLNSSQRLNRVIYIYILHRNTQLDAIELARSTLLPIA